MRTITPLALEALLPSMQPEVTVSFLTAMPLLTTLHFCQPKASSPRKVFHKHFYINTCLVTLGAHMWDVDMYSS